MEVEEAGQQQPQQKRENNWKKLKRVRSKLEIYCKQLIVLGFNSQKYDIPLIRNYLSSSVARLDAMLWFIYFKLIKLVYNVQKKEERKTNSQQIIDD